jgi:hypothetical protein
VPARRVDHARRDLRQGDEERHVHELLPELVGVTRDAVLAEDLAVIGGHDDDGAVGPRLGGHEVEELADPQIGEEDLLVVEIARALAEVRALGVAGGERLVPLRSVCVRQVRGRRQL